MNNPAPKVVLTIAGSDSGAGAGIQADLKSIHANGGYAVTALTSVTSQNTQRVAAAHHLPDELIRGQIDVLFEDFAIAAAKTGMLATARIVSVVSEALRAHPVDHLVVDPVMISTSGYPLIDREGQRAMREFLLPLATLCTPNLPEAEALSGIRIQSLEDVEAAARAIQGLGPRAVLIKGGHGTSEEIVDTLFDGEVVHSFAHRRLATRATHGTGCALSAALATRLARGEALPAAVKQAQTYVARAIARGVPIGSGHSPTDLFFFQSGDWASYGSDT